MESHSLTPHPANTIAAELMYPLSPHLWNMPAPIRLFLYGLPEARLYTQTGHTVTVRLPSTTFATQTRLSRVHDTIFWRLIAQHPLTHKLIPLQRPEYDQRARDIHAQLLLSPYDTIALSEQGTPTELMCIMAEETHCSRELFAGPLNASFHMSEHVTERPVAAFTANTVYGVNGLDFAHYRGCVQASPPHTESTVTQCIKLAMKAAAERPNFRGVLLVPARPSDLLLAQQDIHTTTLTVFPNNSIPLTLPESWRGKGHTSRNYQHLTKRLALLLITSPQCEELPPINMAALKRKLSAFYTSVAPDKLHPPWRPPVWHIDESPLCITGSLASRVPEGLYFWEMPRPVQAAYPGGERDSCGISGTPNLDVINSHPLLMMTGHAPATFASHIQWYGHTAKDTPAIKSALFKTMATHLRAIHKQYTALARNHQLQPEVRRRPPRKQPVLRPPRPPKPPAPPKPTKPPRPVKPIATKAPPRPPTPKQIHPVTRPRGAQKRSRCEGCNLFICPCSPLAGSPPLSHAAAPTAAADEGDDPETLRSVQMAQCATAMLVAPHTAVTVAHPPLPSQLQPFPNNPAPSVPPPLSPYISPSSSLPPPSLPPQNDNVV